VQQGTKEEETTQATAARQLFEQELEEKESK